MAPEPQPVFLDTAYVNARINTRDQWHEAAVRWERKLAAERRQLITTCASFVVMRGRALSEALTTDEHFRQAGFRALLLEDTST